MLLKRNRVGSCCPIAVLWLSGWVLRWPTPSTATPQRLCLSQPDGSSPVPGSLAQLWQFVKLGKDLHLLWQFSLEDYCWSSRWALLLCRWPKWVLEKFGEREGDAVNAASSRMHCNSSDSGMGWGESVSSLQKWSREWLCSLSGFHSWPREEYKQKPEPLFGICSHLKTDMHALIQLALVW